MFIRVIVPPAPILTPADIPGSHAPDDASVARVIAAATRMIDGPAGWLGRAIGVQTIEVAGNFSGCRFRLPCPPLIDIVSVIGEDHVGNDAIIDPSLYRMSGEDVVAWGIGAWLRSPLHRIRYRAGYNGTAVSGGGTGDVPEEAKFAVMLMVQDLLRHDPSSPGLRSETVEGVGVRSYFDGASVSAHVRTAAESLLSGLKVPKV